MFMHTVIIIRPNTDDPFYYEYAGTFSKLEYIELSSRFKSEGRLLSEEYKISDNNLILERSATWNSQQSYQDFLDEWEALYPTHRRDLQSYSTDRGHVAMLTLS
jgi:hypothetical protein